MREIKFRAWDEKEKCWVVGFAIHQNGMFSDWAGCKEVNGKCYADANWEQLKNIPHIKIMQYTGLKDKNGYEIYEGDIVKFHFPNQYNTVVKFKNGHFAFYKGKRMMVDPYYYTNHVWSYAEVIGNIYENPELLEVEGK